MKKFYIILFFMATIAPSAIHGQQDLYKWRAGGGSGVMFYIGDLNSRFFAPSAPLLDLDPGYLSYQVSVERFISPATSLRFSYTQGRFEANDRAIDFRGNLLPQSEYFTRSLNSLTLINDLTVSYYLSSDNDKLFGKRAFISPFISIGAGVTRFNVYGDLFGSSGERYHYWSDNTIRTLAESDPLSPTAVVILQDGKFETDLTALETETGYSPYTLSLPLSVGLKFRFGSRININLEYALRYTLTDHLDDVSGTYRATFDSPLQQYASNPANIAGTQRGSDSKLMDMWSFTSINLYYSFGKRKVSFRPPAIYSSSREGAVERETLATFEPWVPVMVADSSVKPTLAQVPAPKKLITATSDSVSAIPGADTLKQADTLKVLTAVAVDSVMPVTEPVADSLMNANLPDSSDFVQRVDTTVLASPADTIPAPETLSGIIAPDSLNLEEPRFISETDTLITASGDQLFNTTVPANRLFVPFNPMEGVTEQDAGTFIAATREEKMPAEPVTIPGEGMVPLQAAQPVAADMDKVILQERLNLEIERSNFYKEQVLLMRELLLGINRKDSLTAVNPPLPASMDTVIVKPVADPIVTDSVRAEVDPVAEYFTAQRTLSASESSDSVIVQYEKINKEREKELQSLKSRVVSLEEELSSLKQRVLSGSTLDKSPVKTETAPKEKVEVPGVEIFFNTGSSELSPIAKLSLDRIAEFISEEPLTELIIKGFSDVTGSADRNLELSMLRAEAARNYLIAKGVSEGRIRIEYHGADLDYPGDLLRYGRRVEIIILK